MPSTLTVPLPPAGSVRRRSPRAAADVENTDFPAFQEIACTEVLPDINTLVNRHTLCYRHNTHGHHTVHMAVYRYHLIGHIQILDQEFFPRFLGGVTLEITLVAFEILLLLVVVLRHSILFLLYRNGQKRQYAFWWKRQNFNFCRWKLLYRRAEIPGGKNRGLQDGRIIL